ncbi:MAG TPA: family 16 glycoside hydrolase [Phycisphaerae bacterium]|nr:family 16 glycoside hydrolase [Phycisphaerae bacterium]
MSNASLGTVVAMLVLAVAGHLAAAAPAEGNAADRVALRLLPEKVVNRVDEKIYGHFLEHIYHSVNGGLWGEMVWGRSFEEGPRGGNWSVKDDCLVQRDMGTNIRLLFGDPAWTDYEFTLEARKTGGNEGFLILFRVAGDDDFYWCNLGGWGNKRHALERGIKGQGRWGTVGPVVDGAIETDKWYRVRVRCEGRRFQVWLDDNRIIDFTDDPKAHLAGRVGVGTWSTQVQYRRLKVTDLGGKVLHEGLPPSLRRPTVAKWWTSYGDGQVDRTSADPLNGDFCQMIAGDGGETGVQQTPLCIRKGETYRGSLWARGSAADGLVVRLLDGDKTLAECAVPKPGEAWQDCPIVLKPSRGADNATLRVGLRGKGRVWVDQVSLMPDAWRKAGGFRPDLVKAVADLRPPVIRWPGGCFASRYRWKDGVGPQSKRVKYPASIWDDQDTNSYGTDEFVAMCRMVGTQPLIVVNIGMHEPREQRDAYCQEACDWVEYCNGPATSRWGKVRAANGHPEPYGVKYWEIDNEVWGLKPDDYVRVVEQFVAAMKKVDPSIIVAACGSGQLGGAWGAADAEIIAQCAERIDYLSVHHYENPDRFATGPAAAEAFWRGRAALIAKSRNPKVRLYISEWNAQSTDWRTGLYAGGILNAFERCGDAVGMAGPALFLRHASAAAWDNAFINFDHRTWFPAPNYVVMKLWRDHYAPQRVELEGDAGPLNAVATRSEDGGRLYLKVVNPADRPVEVELTVADGFKPGKAAMQLVAPDDLKARNTLEAPQAIRPVAAKVAEKGQTVTFTLPRWAAAVITIPRK